MPTVQVGDIPVHYEEAGAGPPLVLLHGLGGSRHDWEYQIPALSRHFRLIVPDLRGFGGTPSGRGWPTVRRMAADVWGLLELLHVGRCFLMGHSMGGAVALQLALDHTQAVERLVVCNSVPTFQPETLRQHFEVLYRLVVMALLGPARLGRIGAARMFPGEALRGLREQSAARAAQNSRRAYLAALAQLVRWSVVPRLRELTMPVMVIAAEFDYFTHAETVKFAHGLPRGRLHVFKDTRHGLPQESPAAFNALVLRFLKRDRG